MRPEKAYKNLEFLNSPEARAIRILCEYEEPLRRFTQQNVQDTIVFFGSARSRPMDEVQAEIAQCKLELERLFLIDWCLNQGCFGVVQD